MEAIRLWERAAGQGLAEAQYYLGVMYSIGLGVGGTGVQRDDQKAAAYFQAAADQDYQPAIDALAR